MKRLLSLMRACSLALVVAFSTTPSAEAATYDLTQFFPYPNKTLVYLNAVTNTYSNQWQQPWGDGVHTSWHNWGAAFCPRTVSVLAWAGNQFGITDEYSFYDNDVDHRSPMEIWADRYMTAGAPTYMDTSLTSSYFSGSNCTVGTVQPPHLSTWGRAWRGVYDGITDWSYYTGTVPVVSVQHTIYYANNPNDWESLLWYFYHHPTFGWIAIHYVGIRHTPNGVTTTTWDERLTNIY